MSELLEQARRAAKVALAAGAREAAAGAYRARHVELAWRDGKVEKVTEATTRGVGLELYVDGRYAAVSTSDLREGALEKFVARSVALARALVEDPHRKLPDPALYAGRAELDLELEDPTHGELTPEARLAAARAAEEGARGVSGAGKILSVSTSASDTRAESALVHTNGFEGTKRGTDFWVGAEVAVLDPDGRRPEEFAASGGRFRSAMEDPAAIGARAARRALERVGAVKGASGLVTMVVEARAAGRLVGMLFGPLSAASLQQRRSFLEGKQGATVGSALLDVRDEPFVKRGLGSRLFDGEGIAARRFPVIEAGVLKSYYVDNYYGRKLGMEPTTRGASNLVFEAGAKNRAALLAEVKDGLLVTAFLGGNSNATTGDFSFGVQGFEIVGGKVGAPFGEMNVSGNHLELWKSLAMIGDDPYPYSAVRIPTLVFENVMVAGT